MHIDIHGYDTRSAENMNNIYHGALRKSIKVFSIRVIHYGISYHRVSKNPRL